MNIIKRKISWELRLTMGWVWADPTQDVVDPFRPKPTGSGSTQPKPKRVDPV